jgi:hypothetical protein
MTIQIHACFPFLRPPLLPGLIVAGPEATAVAARRSPPAVQPENSHTHGLFIVTKEKAELLP